MSIPAPLIVAGATGYGAFAANTLEGAAACLQAPVDGIEIDVQMTADGHIVAHHDYRLDPSATRIDGEWLDRPSAPLKSLTLAQLQRYDVGRLRPGSNDAVRHPGREEFDNARIPTLPALLQALKDADGPRRLIYVEIKTDPTDAEASPDPVRVTNAVLADLEATDLVAQAKIIAFDWRVLRLAADRNPAVATAHLTLPAAMAAALGHAYMGVSPWRDGADLENHGGSELRAIKAHGGMEWSPYFTDVTPERMAEAADLGLNVGPWGLSKSEDIRRMIDLGVFSVTVAGPAWR